MLRRLLRLLRWIRDLFFTKAPPEAERPRQAMIQPLEDRQFLSVTMHVFERAEALVAQGTIVTDPLGVAQRRGDIIGKWKGTVKAMGEKVRVVLRVGSTKDGIIRGEINAPDTYDGWFPFKVKGA